MDTPPCIRPTNSRRPLKDASSRANQGLTPPSSTKSRVSASHSLPHHESLIANGPLTVRNATSSPAHKRLSGLTSDEQPDSKRNSQISTTSTNASGKGRRRKTHIGPWQLGSDLGKGGCGKVRKVRHSVTGQIAAVKIISKVTAEKARAESLANLVEFSKRPRAGALAAPLHVMPFGVEREVVIMKLLEHKNIVKLYDVWENRNELYLIMEYVNGGELFELIEEHECLEEDETVWLFRQIVAALLYCHRLGIHHRDLKPENILISREKGHIKLVDFGMAALQPKGKLLTTPCGSLHYAAPEVFEKNYDGSKVDVWSLGIILYVMLTGSTPFQYDVSTMANNVALWYHVLKAGVFEMPDELSLEAQDLIRKMLTSDPQCRISLESIWSHPFIHKYDAQWEEDLEDNTIDKWIGPRPIIPTWSIADRTDIDREIFRNLRSLWHSTIEAELIQKLLCKEPNQEKYFYSALQKHREEQLENFVGTADGIGYSTSDHHHIKPIVNPRNVPPVPSLLPVASKSQFSILNDEHLHSRSTLYEPPPSVDSYDPFRASRDVTNGQNANYVKVNVLGVQSKTNRNNSLSGTRRQPKSLRVVTLKNGQKRVSANSSQASLRDSIPSRKLRALSRRSISRSSIGSSSFVSSPSTGVIRASLHKRAVNFSHLRRSSTTSAVTANDGLFTTQGPRKIKCKTDGQPDMTVDGYDATSSPVALLNSVVRSRKEALKMKATRNLQGQDEVIDREARKVSTELEKYCEEVFFRTSVGSSSRTSATASQVAETPPSSVSNRGSAPPPNSLTKPKLSAVDSQRPLPDLPAEHSNLFIKEELIETRNRLAARYAQDENSQNSTYHEVLAHLDALLQLKSTTLMTDECKRPVSTALARSSYLPIISEEDRSSEVDIRPVDKNEGGRRPLGIPTFSFNGPTEDVSPSAAIGRMNPTSPALVAPLVIRKTSGSSTASQSRQVSATGTTPRSHPSEVKPTGKLTPASSKPCHDIVEQEQSNEQSGQTGTRNVQVKKGNWFRRRFQGEDSVLGKRKKTYEDLDDRVHRVTKEERLSRWRRMSDLEEPQAEKSGSVQFANGGLHGKRPGFLESLMKKNPSPKHFRKQIMVGVENDDSPSIASTTGFSNSDRGGVGGSTSFAQYHTLDSTEQNDPRDLGVQQSWLARFLHLKPASQTMCFCVGRGKARQEVVRVLRGWGKFGIRDVILDRERNLVFARLDAVNHLGIKEVSFVVELYVMLEQGRKARLSVCRFTQRNGAASSFRKVVEAMESVLRGKGVLVDRGEMWREMEGVLACG